MDGIGPSGAAGAAFDGVSNDPVCISNGGSYGSIGTTSVGGSYGGGAGGGGSGRLGGAGAVAIVIADDSYRAEDAAETVLVDVEAAEPYLDAALPPPEWAPGLGCEPVAIRKGYGDVDAVLRDYAGQGFGAFKPALGALLIETLGPINARFVALKDDTAALDAILEKGAEKARLLAKPTLDAAYAALGLCR